MIPTILAIATETPKTSLSQDQFCAQSAIHLDLSETNTKLLKRIGSKSRIQKRHTVLANFLEKNNPTTAERNDIYKEAAPKIAASVCQKAIKQWKGDPKLLTHIISVSCTGMMAPGIEFLLIKELNLSHEIERLAINFMGCFGAFKGISIAKALALEDPSHRILVVCTELCSLHFQTDLALDTFVANSLFSDGAAALVIGSNLKEKETALFEIHNQKSTSLPDTTDQMTWEAQNHGYKMRLSAKVPSYLEKHIHPFAKRIANDKVAFSECVWAVHPGGKSILEAISNGCNLEEEQLKASWKVLAEYGNMSSPTFLFVLDEILKTPCIKKWVIGLGFGPGLSIEGILLKCGKTNALMSSKY